MNYWNPSLCSQSPCKLAHGLLVPAWLPYHLMSFMLNREKASNSSYIRGPRNTTIHWMNVNVRENGTGKQASADLFIPLQNDNAITEIAFLSGTLTLKHPLNKWTGDFVLQMMTVSLMSWIECFWLICPHNVCDIWNNIACSSKHIAFGMRFDPWSQKGLDHQNHSTVGQFRIMNVQALPNNCKNQTNIAKQLVQSFCKCCYFYFRFVITVRNGPLSRHLKVFFIYLFICYYSLISAGELLRKWQICLPSYVTGAISKTFFMT